ncbi:RelA/SpoT domain-containing protein [Helicobacter anatolicus]|uniref:RelA/SpoT domain-containing protein n=1 Tax=Helicobacter anatolicus TaxID=2905874 RepID=UPI001E3D2DD1|nr:RelA/SpoT domain-containing protein [Helicobacter anatolicus]MCE3040501.1 RelA/SpoT domain-containing protein [Helicobacter anatolicus]
MSKKQIQKIGDLIRQDRASTQDLEEFHCWRGLYAEIMPLMASSLRSKLKRLRLKPLVFSRRLKRYSSIRSKLIRFPNMQLHHMQDIAGMRIVFAQMDALNQFVAEMKKTYRSSKNNFEFVRCSDYISHPKSDGYRSIHQIYKYIRGKHIQCHGLTLELQIRTKLQHLWATAVEVLGMGLNSKLKSGEGEEHYKEFFKLCGDLFALKELKNLEENQINHKKDLIAKLQTLDASHSILKYLSALSVSTRLEKRKKDYYFVIWLNLQTRYLKINGFPKEQYVEAQILYDALESKTSEENYDVVLISLDGFKQIQKAYPNYYLDCKSFIQTLEKEFEGD